MPSVPNTKPINNNDGFTESLWMEVQLHTFPKLERDSEADVCIVGAGIAGLTCAYTLAKEGKSVIVLDQGAIGGGQTAKTTGHLTWVLDDRFYNLENFFGENGTMIAAESHSSAIDFIEKIIIEEKIDCDFERVNGYLFVSPEDSLDILDKEYKAIQKTKMPIERRDETPFSTSFDAGPCLQFPHQAEFHVLKYLQGLIKALLKFNVRIYCNTHITAIQDGSPCYSKTETGIQVKSHSIIVATNTPINDRFYIHTKQAAYRTYVIGFKVPKGFVPKGLYWDTADPYHYIRIQKHLQDPNSEWLLIGGEDHKTGQDKAIDSKYDHLEEWSRMRFLKLGKIAYKWSGQIYEPIDSLAFIGKNPGDKNVYIVTGDSGNGLTHGTIAGILICDLILERYNPWAQLYEPSRKTLRAIPEFCKEGINASLQYRDWMTPGDIKDIDALSPNEGAIIRDGIKKIAAYKDPQGQVHLHSAFCPHLGGCVRWNHGEKSWDCPCHGSRFDGCGKVVNGPAVNDLKEL